MKPSDTWLGFMKGIPKFILRLITCPLLLLILPLSILLLEWFFSLGNSTKIGDFIIWGAEKWGIRGED
jgi:hypothetical protein